jgi:hypothetical protein
MNAVKPPRPSVRALAERLLGYGDKDCEVAELSLEECLELDSIVFECQCCNNWFHQRDNATKDSSEWTCRDCAQQEGR